MITQKEIAERLGISRTTVARAINGNASIKEETKRKIMELVKEMNYEKNYIGSSLAGRRTRKVYSLVIESKNEFYTHEIIRGLNESAKEYKAYNYIIDIRTTDINDSESQIKELKKILEFEEIDGLIITPLDREKVYNILEPYLNKIKIISLGIRLHEDIPHVGPDHIKQGRIAGGIMSNLLRENENILVIDNGDDRISSKMYLAGFVGRVKETAINLVGPLEGHGIEKSIQLINEICTKEKIDGIYINRYAQDIFERMPKKFLEDKKIVTNGIGKNIKKLIKNKVIIATVMEEIADEGYSAGKRMFELLYKGEKNINNWEVSKSHIIFLENLEG